MILPLNATMTKKEERRRFDDTRIAAALEHQTTLRYVVCVLLGLETRMSSQME
jgi:hypothetical protein